MKILMISTDRALCTAGSPVRDRTLAYAREAGKIDVIVFAGSRSGCEAQEYDGVRIIPTRSYSRFLYIIDALLIARTLTKPDVVTVQDPFEAGIAGFFIARRWRAPLHVQIHTDIFDPHFRAHSLLNLIRVWIAQLILPRAARIRVVSQRIADSLLRRGISAPVAILPIYADVARFSTLVSTPKLSTQMHFLFVGRLEKEKRADAALHALAAVCAKGYDAILTIVGEGSERPALQRLAQHLGTETLVDFVGWQENIEPYL